MRGPEGLVWSRWKRILACFIAGLLVGLASAQVSVAQIGDGSLALQGDPEENLTTHNIMLVGHPTVTRITLWVGEKVQKVDVVIEELGKPEGAVEPPLLVCNYLSIEASDVVKNAVIQFRVSRDWMEQNQVDGNSIVLLRLNDGWSELPTTLVRESDFYFYYESTSPGFSVFAVAGRSAAVSSPLALYAVLSIVGVAGGLSIARWLWTRPMKAFVSLGRLKRVITGRKVRRAGISEREMATAIERLRRAARPKAARRARVEKLELPSKAVKEKRMEDIELLKRLRRKMEEKK